MDGGLVGYPAEVEDSSYAANRSVRWRDRGIELHASRRPVTVSATVRHKNAFRYGFEFVVPDKVSETIRRTCRDLAVDQALFAGLKT